MLIGVAARGDITDIHPPTVYYLPTPRGFALKA